MSLRVPNRLLFSFFLDGSVAAEETVGLKPTFFWRRYAVITFLADYKLGVVISMAIFPLLIGFGLEKRTF